MTGENCVMKIEFKSIALFIHSCDKDFSRFQYNEICTDFSFKNSILLNKNVLMKSNFMLKKITTEKTKGFSAQLLNRCSDFDHFSLFKSLLC